MILIGSSWYLYQYILLGHMTYSADAEALRDGFIANWKLRYSTTKFITGLLSPMATYMWAGTWSLVRVNLLFYIPLLFLFFWLYFSVFTYLKKRPITHLSWLPFFVIAFFILGFIYHVIICMAAYGVGNTPGWYLHILMPWTAPLMGFGAEILLKDKRKKIIFMGLVLYAILFQVMAIWSQIALFAGCAVKNLQKYYSFSGHYFCLDQVSLLFSRLSIFGWPNVAIFVFGCGFLLYLFLIRQIFGTQRNSLV
jgi:hypothetical protein